MGAWAEADYTIGRVTRNHVETGHHVSGNIVIDVSANQIGQIQNDQNSYNGIYTDIQKSKLKISQSNQRALITDVSRPVFSDHAIMKGGNTP